MGRAPCCEKMGMKRGPWTPEEDNILMSYIQNNGHTNWRALPKQAGLLRCGKSCRLRWINYLHPDIKRGNFSKEEEDTILHLHEVLGNRWSAIAARLPGRTDNEIKNVWHTHLKKRLKNYQPPHNSKRQSKKQHDYSKAPSTSQSSFDSDFSCSTAIQQDINSPVTAAPASSSETSTVTVDSPSLVVTPVKTINEQILIKVEEMHSFDNFSIDDSFWTDEILATENNPNFVMARGDEIRVHEFPFSSTVTEQSMDMLSTKMEDDMEFWYNVFTRAEVLPELPQF